MQENKMSRKGAYNRREFLKTAVGTAIGSISLPYIIPSSALGKAGTIAPSNRIAIGCIGVGSMGTGNMQDFMTKDQVRVLAVCDVDRSRRNAARDMVNEKYGNKDCASYNDFRELIARPDIDALSIAVPDHWHSIPAIMGAAAGKHIYGEKPLAYSIAEGRAICNAVKKYGITWQTGSWQRSQRNFRFACELVRNGRIGKVHTVKVGLPEGGAILKTDAKPSPVPDGFDYEMWVGPAPWSPYVMERCHWNFRWVSDFGGGQLTDWAGHMCDIAQWGMNTELTGPIEIEGSGSGPTEGIYDTFSNYRFECKYTQGFTMIVADTSQFGLGVRFEGTDGWVFVSREGMDAHPQSLLESTIGLNEIHLYKSDDHKQNFLDCIRTGRETITPAEIAQRSITIGHLGNIAMQLGRKLNWDPVNEVFINDDQANRLLSRPMRGQWHV
jgi:predicted dehydrogenase